MSKTIDNICIIDSDYPTKEEPRCTFMRRGANDLADYGRHSVFWERGAGQGNSHDGERFARNVSSGLGQKRAFLAQDSTEEICDVIQNVLDYPNNT